VNMSWVTDIEKDISNLQKWLLWKRRFKDLFPF
jgi:hypothetical protein